MIKERKITAEYLLSLGFDPTFPARLWAKVDKTSSPHGCWLWTASTNSKGYGQIGRGAPSRSNIAVHRAVWILCCGPIPEGMEICHDCPGGDNPLCANPEHLWLGTHSENCDDASMKGRSTFGTKDAMAKLTWEQVCAIRSATGTQIEIAKVFDISRTQISRIRNFKRWSHPLLEVRNA